MVLKEAILNVLTMKDIINKYNIPVNRQMCNCPFHKDKTASMKIYENTFYCFSCNRTGDLIQFVQYLFGLNFQEAMEKINYDFNLGFKTRGLFNKKEIIKKQKEYEEKKNKELAQKQKENQLLNKACKKVRIYRKILQKFHNEITFENWEDKVEVIAYLQEKIELLEIYIDNKLQSMIK